MHIEDYTQNFPSFIHQDKHFKEHWDSPSWALFWEPGTGKTKAIIDTACFLYLNKKINGMLVVAPPGVERNWCTDEIPKHMPRSVLKDTILGMFLTSKKDTKNHSLLMKRLRSHDGFSILTISYQAFMTKKGKSDVWNFLKDRDVLYVLDESHYIKTPGRKRTQSIQASGKYAPYKRILTGTPFSTGSFDGYSQIKFLDPDFWKKKGIYTAEQFRLFFGDFKTLTRSDDRSKTFKKLLNYKNVEKLHDWLSEITTRVLKDDVLDLPSKLYSNRYFDISSEQLEVYNNLKKEYLHEFEDGSVLEAELPIVRLLRFQQITCNYVPQDDESQAYRYISDKNPRLQVMENIRDETHNPAIIWARFIHDIDQIMDLLGTDAVRYDGTITDEQAAINKKAFQDGHVKWFVGTAQKGGSGLTLHQAKTVVYYSNSFRLIDRLQSEDRAHRAGMTSAPVHYIDIIAGNVPIDKNILLNLRSKRDVAGEILGDEWKQWI
jgi:SNF2 family DNA or RNA helicase